jgi:hypothetical protein
MSQFVTFLERGRGLADPEQVGARNALGGPGRSRNHRSGRTIFVGVVAGMLAVAGCSSSTGPSSTTSTTSSASAAASSTASAKAGSSSSASYPAGKEQVCAARDDLQASISALTDPSLLLGGTAGIKTAVDQVQTDLNAVAAAGKQDYQPQVTAVQSALQQLETAVGQLGNGSASENMTAIGSAIAATGTAAGALFTQLKTACGS